MTAEIHYAIMQCSDQSRVIFIPRLSLHCYARSVADDLQQTGQKYSGIRNLRPLIESGE